MGDPIHNGLRTIAEHMSLDVLEAPRAIGPNAGMLLDGMRSHGYLNERDGRIALSDVGERALSHSASKCDGAG